MSDPSNFQRLSTFVESIVDRKLKSISLSITSGSGYLKTLVTQSMGYAANALQSSNNAQTSADSSASSASQTLALWGGFTSTYLGIHDDDPQTTLLGNPIGPNAFYIHSTNFRIRVPTHIDATGYVTWGDALVGADKASVIADAMGSFLSLLETDLQKIAGPVEFDGTVTVPRVTDWGSQQPATAFDVMALITTQRTNLASEIQRAEASEQLLTTNLTTEITRAEAAEASISLSLAGEITRAETAEQTLSTNLASETTRAKAAENTNSLAINAEVQRAESAEQTLTTNLNSEVTRAEAAENANATAIAAETQRAQAAENANTLLINNETTRAETAEQTLSTNLASETTRAKAAETALATFLNLFQCGYNANGYWEKRPNIIQQWGFVAAPASSDEPVVTVTLPIQLPDANYHLILTPALNNASNTKDTWVQEVRNGFTVNSFQVQYQRPGTSTSSFGLDGFEWEVKYMVGESTSSDQTFNGTTTTSGTAPPSTNNSGLCPEFITPVLLANTEHNGPGRFVMANQLDVGDYVWTRHEDTMVWGAYKVLRAEPFNAVLWSAENYHRATIDHPMYINDNWVTMEEIGQFSGNGIAVAITVEDAHTFVSLDKSGNQVLNHNKSTNQLQ